MHMKFWEITYPNYRGGDYQDSYINGELENLYRMPGVECEACENGYGGMRQVPYTLPQRFRNRKEMSRYCTIPMAEFRKLRDEITEELRNEVTQVIELQPGDEFQPSYLDIPSMPEADFLWARIGGVLISDRIRTLFEEHGIKGVHFCKVIPRKIGKGKASKKPPIPSTGEPEDMIDEVPLLPQTANVGPYYNLVILNESGLPRGSEVNRQCERCGYTYYSGESREFVVYPDMWKGDDIFILATTLRIVITDSLKTKLERLKPSNVRFKPMSPAE